MRREVNRTWEKRLLQWTRSFEMAIHPLERFRPHFRGIDMALAGIDDAFKFSFLAIQPIYWAHGRFNGLNSVHRRSSVVVAVEEQNWPRRDERDNGFGIEMIQQVGNEIINAMRLEQFVL